MGPTFKTSSLIDHERLVCLTCAQLEMLQTAIHAHSSKTFADAYMEWGIPWTDRISEWNWQKIVRELFGINPDQIDDDCLDLIWRALDKRGLGYISVEELFKINLGFLVGGS